MNKFGQFITTVVIGAFAVFLVALIALPMVRTPEAESKEPSTAGIVTISPTSSCRSATAVEP